MNASIHDEQIPLKILHKTGSVVLIFSSCRRLRYVLLWHCSPQLGKGPEGDIWVAHHSVHYTQEEGGPGLGPGQSDPTVRMLNHCPLLLASA